MRSACDTSRKTMKKRGKERKKAEKAVQRRHDSAGKTYRRSPASPFAMSQSEPERGKSSGSRSSISTTARRNASYTRCGKRRGRRFIEWKAATAALR